MYFQHAAATVIGLCLQRQWFDGRKVLATSPVNIGCGSYKAADGVFLTRRKMSADGMPAEHLAKMPGKSCPSSNDASDGAEVNQVESAEAPDSSFL